MYVCMWDCRGTYITRGSGGMLPRENLSFRLHKVVSEAILDSSRLILTLK